MTREQVLAYLEQDTAQNAPLVNSLLRGEGEILSADERGVLLLDKPSGILMLTAEDEVTAERLLDGLEKCPVMICCQPWCVTVAEKRFVGLRIGKPCRQVIHRQTAVLENPTVTLCVPTEEQLLQIDQSYELEDLEGLRYLRSVGRLFSAIHEGEFVGYIGRHHDGSIGLLEVFPSYRRRGYAEQMGSLMMQQVLAGGEIPYGHIYVDNHPSLAMQEKYGAEFARETIAWVGTWDEEV